MLLLVVTFGFAMMFGLTGAAIDRMLMPLRFGLLERQASGKLAIVEMDAESAAAIARWPWSRSNYASVVDRLRKAGAASIVFDVDFSSPSDTAGDRAFAAALHRARGLVALPTFGQGASSQDRRTIDALPIPMLRADVAMASVSIRPDPDGQVREMTMATMTAGQPRPSLSAYMTARSGVVDQEFPIDMSIDPSTIPRLSFVAVRDGRFDPAAVRGRNILIGATAVEMGDRYGTPQWGVLPGVVVQALAAETLTRGVPSRGSRTLMLLVAATIALAMLSRRSPIGSIVCATLGIGLLVGAVLYAQHVLLVTYPIATAAAMIGLTGILCLTREVTDRFRSQRAMDEATGLPNGRALLDWSRRSDSVILAVAQVGNFDAIRAVLGEAKTSDVIRRVSERLALVGEDNLVFRTTEQQLTLFLPQEQPVNDTLHGLRAIMLQPVEVGGRRVDVAMSFGITTGPSADMERLLANAALAAEQAKSADMFWKRADADVAELERSISMMGELDNALANGEVEVFYQPKYDLAQQRIASVEALVRWRHPERGFIGPDLFIPAAERSNRIAPLTLHVLSQVIRDVAAWRPHHPHVTAAINISAKLLSSASFNAAVEELVGSGNVPASALVFEVTESAAMADGAAAVAALRRYRKLGIAVSMDDYGTGQSTLSYLQQLPLSELKIDRSFVQFAHRNDDDAILVRSTIELAHALGLKVVAEGVEEPGCYAFLESVGCDMIQGYLISRPIPVDALNRLLDGEYRWAA
ncbi:EAL domain-containing protein [Sphingomonas sp. A2-49]|uniref:putative bifunctional diguanylate cyclase/phosphodiesterase n=1 Tax=Sphingomonas sp. A2-49 TaxID=1391375 RepID=UPI0021CE3E02|nr:EAL domain-containing protein [Sphingomonas sp. A2-49]MCU6456103.1 EAL domain-containing protein [Sphingomonas sp. A2-49]